MRLDKRTSHHHRHGSASIAAASEAGSQPTSPDFMAASGGMTPATLLARTYSGPTVVAAITAASTGRKMQQRAALLQRISADAISVGCGELRLATVQELGDLQASAFGSSAAGRQ